MSNPNKHTPLSPEELFKLLDNTSNKVSDFDELDDFEREALEGFSKHSDSKKAKALTEELNLAISQKSSGTETKEVKKNKVIWFSAAASIVLIIMISVFFFNQSKEESQTIIVINEDKKLLISPAGTVPPLESMTETTISSNLATESRGQEFAKLMQVDGVKKEEEENMAGISNEPTLEYSENKPVLSIVTVSKEEAKSRREGDYDALKKQGEALDDRMDAKEKSKSSNLEEEGFASDISVSPDRVATNSAAQKIVIENANTKSVKDETFKADADKNAKTKKSAEKQIVTKETAKPVSESYGAVGNTQPATSPAQGSNSDNYNNNNVSTTSSGKSNNNSAYYTGSEMAIRDLVLNYFKDKSLATPVGKYNIKGTVDANGKLKVGSVTTISKEDCKCSKDLEKALNAMKKWNSATSDGKDVSSNVEFVLAF